MRLDAEGVDVWREMIVEKVTELPHPAWGPEHCRRLYQLCKVIVGDEGLEVDDDILFSVAWLHDIGTFDEFACGEVPPECAARGAERILSNSDFPKEKLDTVIRIIRENSFEGPQRDTNEARVLRDADMLELMGPTGMVRLLSAVGHEEWLPDAREAIGLALDFNQRLPGELYTETARKLATERAAAGISFIEHLEADIGGLAWV